MPPKGRAQAVLLLVILLVLRSHGAGAGTISCEEDFACSEEEHVCTAGEACVLNCSGPYACIGLSITAAEGQTLAVACTGDGAQTCRQMKVLAAGATAVSFTCATAGGNCGYETKVYCPGCDQANGDGGCPSATAGTAVGGGDPAAVCGVACTASADGQAHTCSTMDVYPGPDGAAVSCAEDGTSDSQWTCRNLQIHAPAGADAAANAPLSIGCVDCAGRAEGCNPACSCCDGAEVTPATSCPAGAGAAADGRHVYCGAHWARCANNARCAAAGLTSGTCCPAEGTGEYSACCDNTREPTTSPTMYPTVESGDINCMGNYACTNDEAYDAVKACPDGEDCALTCSGTGACQGLTIFGPKDGAHSLTVACEGSGMLTCKDLTVHAEHASGVSVSCGTGTHNACQYVTVFCPGCDYTPEDAWEDGCAAGGNAAGTCALTCTAYGANQMSTCEGAGVFAGPGGAAVECAESGTATSKKTCRALKLRAPIDAAARASAALALSCAACAGYDSASYRCCANAKVVPSSSCAAGRGDVRDGGKLFCGSDWAQCARQPRCVDAGHDAGGTCCPDAATGGYEACCDSTYAPTTPTADPTAWPTRWPGSKAPTGYPAAAPTRYPTGFPLPGGTAFPNPGGTKYPTAGGDTKYPTVWPTAFPAAGGTTTKAPTAFPSTKAPTGFPSKWPTNFPSAWPTTAAPTEAEEESESEEEATSAPSTKEPTIYPSAFPSTKFPSAFPSTWPSEEATPAPTEAEEESESEEEATSAPSTKEPTSYPSDFPTKWPTSFPTEAEEEEEDDDEGATPAPTGFPLPGGSKFPTSWPSKFPTKFPTASSRRRRRRAEEEKGRSDPKEAAARRRRRGTRILRGAAAR